MRRIAVATLAAIMALGMLVGVRSTSALGIDYLNPTGFTAFTYEPLSGVSFSTQIPSRVQAADACAYLPIDFTNSGVSARNALSVSVEIWSATGTELASDTIYRQGDWNGTGGPTRMELFDCDWAPGNYTMILWASYNSSTLIKQGEYPLTVSRPAPTIASVSPNSGPSAGGTRVSISGTGFTDATGVTFGGSPAGDFRVYGDTSISVTAPVSTSGGPADVVVSGPHGNATAAGAFVYVAPDATSLSLAAAPKKVKKGKKVTLTGRLTIPSKGLIITGGQVSLWRSTGGRYSGVGTVVTDGQGNFVKSIKMKRSARFAATYGGSSSFTKAESAAVRVKVKR